MTKNMTRTERLAATSLVAATLATNVPSSILRAEPQQQQKQQQQQKSSPTDRLGLSDAQLFNLLGIGGPTPENVKTYKVGLGWQGAGKYVFLSAEGFETNYLTKVEHLNNWTYVITRKKRDAPEDGGKLQPVDPALKKAVDKDHNFFTKLRRAPLIIGNGTIGVVERIPSPIQIGQPRPQQAPVPTQAPPQQQGGQPPIAVQQQIGMPQQQAPTTISSAERVGKLTPEALKVNLGFGNEAPIGAQTLPEKDGWKVNGFYTFIIDGKPYTTPYLTDKQQFWNWCGIIDGRERTEIVLTPLQAAPDFAKAVRARTLVNPTTPTAGLNLTPTQLDEYLGIRANNIPLPGTPTYAALEGWKGPGIYAFPLDGKSYLTPVALGKEVELADWGLLLLGRDLEIRMLILRKVSPEVEAALNK
jgi:hypothetical protein